MKSKIKSYISLLIQVFKKKIPLNLIYINFMIDQIHDKKNYSKKLEKLLKKYFANANRGSLKILDTSIIANKNISVNKIKFFLLEINKLPFWESYYLIKNLMLYFRFFGNLHTYSYFRASYRCKLLEMQDRIEFINIETLKACLELNNLDIAKEIIKKKKNKESNKSQITQISNFIKFLESPKKNNLSKRNSNNKFKKIIEKSELIIKGPHARTEKKLLTKKTVIVGINNLSLPLAYKKLKLISYYNGQAIQDYFNIISQIAHKIDFLCLKSKESYQIFKKNQKKNKTRLRVFANPSHLMLNDYGPNLVQCIIYDLLQFKTYKIKLTGITFFLGNRKSMTATGYKKIKSLKDKSINLRLHEPISNFCFIKNLWLRNIINVSADVEKILKLSENRYSYYLNKQYRHHL